MKWRAGVAGLLACLAGAAAFSGCGQYTDFLFATGPAGLFIFDCTKGQVGEYTVYNFLGITVASGTFDTATHSCVDVQDDLQAGLIGATSPTVQSESKMRPGSLATTVSTSSPPEYLLDVGNYYAVQILDPNTVTFQEVDLPAGVNAAYPVSMAITPDRKFLWVLQYAILPNNFGIPAQPSKISIMDTAKRSFTGSFNLPSGLSVDTVRFSADGATAYISNNGAPSQGSSGVPANSSVVVVDVASQKVTNTIQTPHGAGFEVMSPDGPLLYTIDNNLGIGTNYVTAIDATTGTVAASASLPNGALKMFLNPSGTRLYVYWYSGIVVLDTATLQQVASIPTVGFSLRNNFAAFAPDGGSAWFCNCGYGIYYKVDLRTNTVINTVHGDNLGHGFMFSTSQ
ncbi:MAG: hypothetical protein WDO73_10820 [Ignavibacteriota bacterium]